MLQFDAIHRDKFPNWYCQQVKADVLAPNVEEYQLILERRSKKEVVRLAVVIEELEETNRQANEMLRENEHRLQNSKQEKAAMVSEIERLNGTLSSQKSEIAASVNSSYQLNEEKTMRLGSCESRMVFSWSNMKIA